MLCSRTTRGSKRACVEAFDCDIHDCSVHLERTLEAAMGRGQKAKRRKKRQKTVDGEPVARSVWDEVRTAFNKIKSLATTELAQAACHAFIKKFLPIAPRMARLFSRKCFEFHWTRADVGAGSGSDNNPLEATNRTMKESAKWRRHSLTQFGPWVQNYASQKGRDDFGFNSRFNHIVWNNEAFNLVDKWMKEDFLNGAIETTYNDQDVLLFPSDFMSTRIGGIKNTAQRESAYLAAGDLFLDMMTRDRDALNTSLELLAFDEVLERSSSFALLSPAADYNAKKTQTLWRMLGVREEKQDLQPLSKCTCRDYMHYLVCPHVILFHMHHEQLFRPASFKLVKHVNKGAAFGSAVPGYPLHTRKIPKGAALSRGY